MAALGIIAVIDFGRLLFFKQEKRQKNADAAKVELETARDANTMLKEQLHDSRTESARKDEIIKEKDALIEEKSKQIAALHGTMSALFDDMCIHKGCTLRKPHQGQGAQWYEKYREDPALGADYTPINTLLKLDRASRQKREREAEISSPPEEAGE